jgi:hypothetical protein
MRKSEFELHVCKRMACKHCFDQVEIANIRNMSKVLGRLEDVFLDMINKV